VRELKTMAIFYLNRYSIFLFLRIFWIPSLRSVALGMTRRLSFVEKTVYTSI